MLKLYVAKYSKMDLDFVRFFRATDASEALAQAEAALEEGEYLHTAGRALRIEDLAPLPRSEELLQMPKLHTGHTMDLHRESRADVRGAAFLIRFWVSRCSPEDGETHRVHVEAMPYDRSVTWCNVGAYEAIAHLDASLAPVQNFVTYY